MCEPFFEEVLHNTVSLTELEKSFEERIEEDELIERKLELVSQRNKIVDSIDEDRLRYRRKQVFFVSISLVIFVLLDRFFEEKILSPTCSIMTLTFR